MLPLILVLVALTLVACTLDANNTGITDFVTSDPILEKMLLDCAQEWTDLGLIIAARITVNINPKGIPVKFVPRADLPKLCNADPAQKPGACIAYKGNDFHAIYIADDEKDRLDRLRIKILHELIHIIVPMPDHLPKGIFGIMTGHGETDGTITKDDLNLICSHTQCINHVA